MYRHFNAKTLDRIYASQRIKKEVNEGETDDFPSTYLNVLNVVKIRKNRETF